jgi:hypothetical protein
MALLRQKLNRLIPHPGYNGGGKGGEQSAPQQTTTVQKADPWGGVQPFLTEAYGRASELYGPTAKGPELYPNQMYVSPDPLRLEARSQMEDYARTQMPSDIGGIRGAYGTLLGAADVNANPYLAAAAQGAIRPITQQLTEEVLPQIRGGAIQTGQYGGSRQGLAEGTAIGKATQAMADRTAQMYSDAYGKGLDTMTRAMLFGPQVMQLSQLPYQTLEQLGAAKETDEAQKLQEQMYRYEYGQKIPYTMLSDYLGLLQGAGGYGTTTGITTAPGVQSYSNPVMGALGGASAGASLAPLLGVAGPWSALGGAALGALFS